MPSSRKEKHKIQFKPVNHNVHSSLSSRSSTSPISSTASTSQETLPETVTARIEHLRRTQAPAVQTSHVTERPRPNILASRRRVAGPPPPRSWVEGDVEARVTFKYGAGGVHSAGTTARRWPELTYFPGLKLPKRGSLQHIVLKSMAIDFDWHVEYDHTFLSVLPVELKGILLSYIASYGPEAGISATGLKCLMLSPSEVDDLDLAFTGSAQLTRLDLCGSIGRALTLKQLEKMWHIKARHREEQASSPIESWDMEEPTLPATIPSSLRFPALTHLSLAYPGPSASWNDLLHLSRHLGALTHLSLAFWPAPALASTSTTKGSNLPIPPETIRSSSQADAAHIVRLLSRATPSLTYLSLDGCQEWWSALQYVNAATPAPARHTHRQTPHVSFDSTLSQQSSMNNLIWTTSWRHVTTLSLSQCWIPKNADSNFLFRLYNNRGRSLDTDQVSEWQVNTPEGREMDGPSVARLQQRLQRLTVRPPPRERTDLPLPVPATGEDGTTTLPRREFPTSRLPRDNNSLHSSQHAPRPHSPSTSTSAPTGESYTIHPSPTIRQAIVDRSRRQQWCTSEIEALSVENFIRAVRQVSGKGAARIVVEHGWGKRELVGAGYDEQALWESGFETSSDSMTGGPWERGDLS